MNNYLVLNLNNLYVSDGLLYDKTTIIERSPLFFILGDIVDKLEQINISPNTCSSIRSLSFLLYNNS